MDKFSHIYDAYPQLMEKRLPHRRFGLGEFYQVLGSRIGDRVRLVEEYLSFRKNPIRLLAFGHGPKVVLAWSQMHGNEPISTLALMDVVSALDSGAADCIADSITLYMLPLLNPDGHADNDRRNAQGIDINRDALDLASPEARILSSLADKLKPRFALNLHDQELYYTTRPALKQTAVALLAPEFDYDEHMSEGRASSMAICSSISRVLMPLAPGRIAKYMDTYTPTAFGDWFMRRGVSSVLIESGSVAYDEERTFARRMVYVAILEAIRCISAGDCKSTEAYDALPNNIRNNAFDLMLRGLRVVSGDYDYRVDVGIRRIKPSHNVEDFTDDVTDYRILGIGNLSGNGAIIDVDASGCELSGSYTQLRITAGISNLKMLDKSSGKIINVINLLNIK